ncbi:MAG: hypothetical protein IJP03_03750 [Christensenellaceae bacterium]|nr:hypothetical protein [Christensenellaceae bacterium]
MIKVIGIGDYVIDRYFIQKRMFAGGNALNFAVNSRILGHEAAFLCSMADDRAAQIVCDTLNEYGVDHSRCVNRHGHSWLCSTHLFENGERIITDDNDMGVVKNLPLRLTDTLVDYICGFDMAHFNVNGFTDANDMAAIKSRGVFTVYDFADLWEGEKELRELCPHMDLAFLSAKDGDLNGMKPYLQLAVQCGCSLALTTAGGNGSLIYDGTEFYRFPAYAAGGELIDTLGAGDAFLAAFSTTYRDGLCHFKRICGEDTIGPANWDTFRPALIAYAAHTAALFAVRCCKAYGAFGTGLPLEEL